MRSPDRLTGQPGCHSPESRSACASCHVSFATPGRGVDVAAVLAAAAADIAAATRIVATAVIEPDGATDRPTSPAPDCRENAHVVTPEEIASVELFADIERDVLVRLAQVVAD